MMQQNPQKISVAMCTYNGEKYIRDQLESILNQTHPVDEIIICDDGSTDDTIAVAKELLSGSIVKYTIEQNKKQLGVTRNFEKAISLCTGDIIFLSDQDDIWDRGKVATMIALFNDTNVVLAFSDAYVIDGERRRLNDSLHQRLCFMQTGQEEKALVDAIVRLQYTVHGCLMAIRHDFVVKIMPFRESLLNHDAWIMYCATLMGKMVYCKRPLISYRIHQNSTTQGEEGQNKWRRVTQVGNSFSRRFSLNVFRQQRCELMQNACKYDQIKHNMFWVAYNKSLAFYTRIQMCENATPLRRICLLLYSVCDGSYYYRFMDRGHNYSTIEKIKILLSDIVFMIRYKQVNYE